MKTILIVLIFTAWPAYGQSLCGFLFASVDGAGSVTADVEVYRSQFETMPEDWIEIVVVRKIHGTCQDPVVVSPEAVWDIPKPGESLMKTWREPIPLRNRHYRYEVMARDSSEQLHHLHCCCVPSYDVVSHGEAICLRARLHYSSPGFYHTIPCEEGCWEGGCELVMPYLGIDEGQALLWHFTGQVLDFYGDYHPSGGTPSFCEFVFDRIEEHDGDCGPIPNRTVSWGDVKASYR